MYKLCFSIVIFFTGLLPLNANEIIPSENLDLLYKTLFSDYPALEEFYTERKNEPFSTVVSVAKDQLIKAYFSGEFTMISQEQFQKCLFLTENPKWSGGDFSKVDEYYNHHKETKLDSLLRFAATHILGVIIHGNINQEELGKKLNRFDIRKLLNEGPYDQAILSYEAQKLIYDSLQDVSRVYDVHLHNLGYDEGNYLNPAASVRGLSSWIDYFTFMVLRYASGTSDPIGSTQEARKRIHLYVNHFPKLTAFILPIQKAISSDGQVNWEKTGNFLKNYSALVTANSFIGQDSTIVSAVSVHPFDDRWREKLQKAHFQGIRLVKWMPPQSIPPDVEQLNDYYREMKRLGMTLIAHSGPEHTIPTNDSNKEWEDWGNPLRFRKALQLGVDVILAHCGHKHNIPDLDQPDHPLVSGQELFFRIAREAHQKNHTGEWTGKVYGDLAAVTTHYGVDFIKGLLLHANEDGIRYIYGSDYPHTNLIQPKKDAYDLCSRAGLLEPYKVKPLKEIREWNPLLANYVFTRNLEMKGPFGEILKFPISTFTGEFKDGELFIPDLPF